MSQSMINFRMDSDLKKRMEETCKKMGLTMTAAFTMFATKVTNEKRIQFVIDCQTCSPPIYNNRSLVLSSLPTEGKRRKAGVSRFC